MRIIVDIDEKLIEDAQKRTGITDHAALIREGLQHLVQRESARRLKRLGGSEPTLKPPRRRRLDD